MACGLVVVSASPQGYHYDSRHQGHPSYQTQHPTYQQPQASYHYAAPVAPAAPTYYTPARPAYSAPYVQAVPVAAPNFDLDALLRFIQPFMPSAKQSLGKATNSLDKLMIGLPAALKHMDPALKADFGKVNVVIAEVCDKMVAEAKPYAQSYYTPEGIRTTCDFINKTANDILLGMDDPAIVQYYTNKLKEATTALQNEPIRA